MKTNKLKGISLIVLVITIIIMIILVGAIILSLNSSNITGRASEAVKKSNKANAEQVTTIARGEYELKKEVGELAAGETLSKYIEDKLKEAGFKEEDYGVTDKGTIYEAKMIPNGFYYVGGTIEEGLVISDVKADEKKGAESGTLQGSQFVWVPVPYPVLTITTAQSQNEDTVKSLIDTKAAEGKYPMTTQIEGQKNYRGVLYDFGNNTTPKNPPVARKYSLTGYREPAVVNGTGTQYDASASNNVGITEQVLQDEFNAMVNSVKDNGGFYMGRYETSVASGSGASIVVQSKGNKVAMNGNMTVNNWYGMYAVQKAYASSKQGVSGGMIWGSQYNQLMIWMLDVPGSAENTTFIRNSIGKGWCLDNASNNTERITGKSIDSTGKTTPNQVKHIWDIGGNLNEYTLMAYSSNCRGSFGGWYEDYGTTSYPAYYWYTQPSGLNYPHRGSRIQLFLI
ncbi:MAG: hypothetical protein PHD20_06625 [Clostridia bacterium]|nr:hypothetical protein [Clostridia bacterium]